jgi:hypothetical protein
MGAILKIFLRNQKEREAYLKWRREFWRNNAYRVVGVAYDEEAQAVIYELWLITPQRLEREFLKKVEGLNYEVWEW